MKSRIFAATWAFFAAFPAAGATPPEPLSLLDEGPAPGIADWSWGAHQLKAPCATPAGQFCATFAPRAWNALALKLTAPLAAQAFERVGFLLRVDGLATQILRISLENSTTKEQAGVTFSAAPGPWREMIFRVSEFGLPAGFTFDKINLQNWRPVTGGEVALDRLQLLPAGAVTVPLKTFQAAGATDVATQNAKPAANVVEIKIDSSTPGTPVSNLIYGINDNDGAEQTTKLKYPLRRYGGNATTRHNWKNNTSNRGADYFFLNVPDENKTFGDRKNLAFSDYEALKIKDSGAAVVFTLPTIGWTPKDRAVRWGFSVKKFGKQAQAETDLSHGDAGNGKLPDGTWLDKADATDTSQKIGPKWDAEWVKHLKALFGGKGAKDGGIQYYELDNEPHLWHETHRDVRVGDPAQKNPLLTYDELWDRTVAYATAIKQADSAAEILGPDAFGWCGYFGSASDIQDKAGGCVDGKDRQAHGGKPLLAWYLRQVCAHKARTGIRLVDWLDVHFYPELLNAPELKDKEDLGFARRLAAVRSLDDPNYTDDSWINEKIQLLPRLKEWIAEECPGTRVAITEWSFGWQQDSLSSAIAAAEALAVFGRDGVGLAAFWGFLAQNSRLEAAFRLFLDYDGAGGNALDAQSLKVASSDAVRFPAYALRQPKKLLIYLFNKTETEAQVHLALPAVVSGKAAQIYRLSSTQNLTASAPTPASAVLLPARSVTLVVVRE